jgi:hypothetical protein
METEVSSRETRSSEVLRSAARSTRPASSRAVQVSSWSASVGGSEVGAVRLAVSRSLIEWSSTAMRHKATASTNPTASIVRVIPEKLHHSQFTRTRLIRASVRRSQGAKGWPNYADAAATRRASQEAGGGSFLAILPCGRFYGIIALVRSSETGFPLHPNLTETQ